jgi:hypothetical protein
MRAYDPNEAVQTLDLLLDFFADGKRWTRRRFNDGQGRRCLVGALAYLHYKHQVASDWAAYFLRQAIGRLGVRLTDFNDDCRKFADLRSVIVKARALAFAEAERDKNAASRACALPVQNRNTTPTPRTVPSERPPVVPARLSCGGQ